MSWKHSQTKMIWGLFLNIQPRDTTTAEWSGGESICDSHGMSRAMMNHAGFTMAKRQQLWCEAAQTATQLDSILVQDSAKSPPFTRFLEWMQSMPSI